MASMTKEAPRQEDMRDAASAEPYKMQQGKPPAPKKPSAVANFIFDYVIIPLAKLAAACTPDEDMGDEQEEEQGPSVRQSISHSLTH